MQLARGYSTGCRGESGNRGDVEKEVCLAANGKRCTFNSNLVYSFNSTFTDIVTYNTTGGIERDQCILVSQGFTSVEMEHGCQTWDDTLYDQCCIEYSDISAYSDRCQIWDTVKGIGYVQAYFTLEILCGVLGSLDTVFEECCKEHPEYREPCEIMQNLTSPFFYDYVFNDLYYGCGIDFLNDLESSCANNCKGVKLSNIVVGGSAIIATATLSTLAPAPIALSPIVPALVGIGALGLGATGLMFSRTIGLCMGPLFCITSQGTCCTLINSLDGLRCPPFC